MHASRIPFLVALAAVALAGCGRVLPGSHGLRLHYVIAIAEDAGHGARVTVEIARQAAAPAAAAQGPAPRARAAATGPRARARTRPLSLNYRVVAPESPHGGVGFACYRGFELLAQPAGVDLSPADTIDARVPPARGPGAGRAARRARGRSRCAARRGPIAIGGDEFMTLLQSYVAVGDYGVRVLPAVDNRLPADRVGPPPARRRERGRADRRRAAPAARARRAVRAGPPARALLGRRRLPVLGPRLRGQRDRPLDRPAALARRGHRRAARDCSSSTAHELAHFWLGGAFPFPRPEDHWFVEGASDYYGLVARVRAGFLDPAHAGDELAEQWALLVGQPLAERADRGPRPLLHGRRRGVHRVVRARRDHDLGARLARRSSRAGRRSPRCCARACAIRATRPCARC